MKIEEAAAIVKSRSQPEEFDWELLEASEVLRDAYLALHREDDGENCEGCQTIDAVRNAILKYYAALDRRKHGGDAADEAFKEIRDAMGMQWEPGATLRGDGGRTEAGN